jgi:hypothetical protein
LHYGSIFSAASVAIIVRAGDQTECMYSTFADVKFATIQQLLTGTKQFKNGIFRHLPESQNNLVSGGMFFTAM